ncbi:restriction endonuclease, partial [Candidatus Gastranaerophilus sp. (ex Termes propinquus)]
PMSNTLPCGVYSVPSVHERSRNLLDCHIAGFTYYDGLDVIGKLKRGTPVAFKGEPNNPSDPNAVAIYYKDTKLGYVPKSKNSIVSNLLYFGYSDIIEAKINICKPEEDPENQFHIVIKLKDNRKSLKRANEK